MNTLYPAPLKQGDIIGVIAPSGRYDIEKLKPAVEYIEAQGFKVIFHPQTSAIDNQFAGTPDEKVNALHEYFSAPDIKAIFCTCGGNGAIHLLDKIDYNLVKKNPKIFMGFSDITLLLNTISSQTGLITFHGPTLTRIAKIDSVWRNQMIGVLTNTQQAIEMGSPDMEGVLYGGNLSVMQTLIGTAYAPDMIDTILLIEDTNDHLSRYDRMTGHMKQAGWISQLSGLITGEFLDSQDNTDRPFGYTIEEIIKKNAPNKPIAFNAPFGHGERLCTLPIGAKAVLKNGTLSFKAFA